MTTTRKAQPRHLGQGAARLVVSFCSKGAQFGLLALMAPMLVDRGVPIHLVGVVMAAAAAGSGFAQFFAGRLGDRVGGWWLCLGGLVLQAAGTLGLALFQTWPQLAVSDFVGSAGYAIASNGVNASIAALTSGACLEREFGLLASARSLGMVLGPFLIGLVAAQSTAAVPWGVCAVLLLGLTATTLGPRETGRTATTESNVEDFPPSQTDGGAGRDAPGCALPVRQGAPPTVARGFAAQVAPLVLIIAAFAGLGGIYSANWGLYLRDLGSSNSAVAWSFAVFGVPMVLVAPRAGKVAPRLARWKVAVLAALVAAAMAYTYAILHNPWIAIALSPIEAAGLALAFPLVSAQIARLAPPGREASSMSIVGATDSVVGAAGSACSGMLIAAFGTADTFRVGGAYCAALSLFAGALLLRRERRSRQEQKRAAPELV